MVEDSKYVVFKREEWEEYWHGTGGKGNPPLPMPLSDAVVIRTQDVFASSALWGYVHAIRTVWELATATGIIPKDSGGVVGDADNLAWLNTCTTCDGSKRWMTTTEDSPTELIDIGPCPDCGEADPRVETLRKLRDVADYFADRAMEAERRVDVKVPD